MVRALLRRLRRGRTARPAAPTRPGRDGFSLVEILVVLVILAVGVLPIAVIQHQARRSVNEADRRTQAIAVAQMQLERMKNLGFGNIAAQNGATGQVNWDVQVANVSFGLDRVTVTTTWQERGEQQQMVVSDLISMR